MPEAGTELPILEWASTIYDLILDPAELATLVPISPSFFRRQRRHWLLALGKGETFGPHRDICIACHTEYKISTAEAYRELDESRKRAKPR